MAVNIAFLQILVRRLEYVLLPVVVDAVLHAVAGRIRLAQARWLFDVEVTVQFWNWLTALCVLAGAYLQGKLQDLNTRLRQQHLTLQRRTQLRRLQSHQSPLQGPLLWWETSAR